MLKQEIFNTVKNHLLTQKCKAVDLSGQCQYESNGKKCAIGVMIVEYKQEYEEMPVDDLISLYPDLDYLLPSDLDYDDGIEFLLALQYVHDQDIVEKWADCLNVFAHKYNMTE